MHASSNVDDNKVFKILPFDFLFQTFAFLKLVPLNKGGLDLGRYF
jgi:hypothetical protein